MATSDRTVTAGPNLRDLVSSRARPVASPWAGGWRQHWFAPAQGLWPWLIDVALAVTIAAVQVFGTSAYNHDVYNYDSRSPAPSPWDLDAGAAILLAIGPLALLFRRRWPEATLAVTVVAAAGYLATGYPRGPAGYPAFAFAMVGAILLGRRAFTWAAVAVAYVAFSVLPFLLPDEVEKARGVAGLATNLVWIPLVGALAEIVRIGGERRVERAQAEQEDARRRASEERLLIARELHDVLAHNISLINVQSGVALHLLDEQPERAGPALAAINEASEEALGELRSVIDVLHRVPGLGENGADGEPETWAPRSPTAGLRDLDDLVRRTRAAGLEVELAVEGEAGPMPPSVELAAFRVVQESLTNVVRHAGSGVRATVRLAYSPSELLVQVDDDGQGAAHAPDRPAPGRGIVGMRERVHALGGKFAAGPRPGRGFRVRAKFPLHPGAA